MVEVGRHHLTLAGRSRAVGGGQGGGAGLRVPRDQPILCHREQVRSKIKSFLVGLFSQPIGDVVFLNQDLTKVHTKHDVPHFFVDKEV